MQEIRKPDEHTKRQRALSVVIDIELDALEPDDDHGFDSIAIARVRREEERRGARRIVL